VSFRADDPGVLGPDDLSLVRNIYDRITSEPWASSEPFARDQFAKFVVRMYTRGMCEPERLFRVCLIAAKHKLSDQCSADWTTTDWSP